MATNEQEEFEFRARAEREASQQQKPRDWKSLIGQSVKDVFQRPASYAKSLATNPETMANAMPAALGTGAAIAMPWGGNTVGTAAGQGIRDLALKGLNKPVPSGMQHGLELGGAVLGDLIAVPAMKKAEFGSQIGRAEKDAGLITRAPTKAVTPGTVGETLNNLEAQIDAGTINNPQTARDAKAVINQIYKNPKIYEQTSDISVQAQRVSKKVQDLLNKMVPGRAAPAQGMAQAMKPWNAFKRGYQALPWPVRVGALGATGVETAEVLKKLMGG